ncbi:MAG TPA: chemotaxis protein CheW [Ktedonobacteraceae bacterium]
MLQRNTGQQSQSAGLAGRDTGSRQFSDRRTVAAPQSSLQVDARLNNVNSLRDLPNVAVESAPIGEQYLVFSLLDQEFAMRAEHVQGVERLADVTPVPNVASWISGVINLRGSIASVVDLRAFLGLARLPYNPRTRLLSVNCNDMVICLVVDSVSDMVPISQSAIISGSRQVGIPHWIAPYTSGSVFLGKRAIILLDAAHLLFSDKMQHYS